MTGAEAALPVATAAAKIVITRGVPTGLRWAHARLRRKVIMVAGPSQAGKTTFLRYLQWGIFEHEQEHQVTLRWSQTKPFEFSVGPNKDLRLSVTSIDLPGQGADLSEFAFMFRPHALVLILDCSPGNQEGSAEWLENYLRKLDEKWRHPKVLRKNRLRTLIVVMNKIDTLAQSSTVADARIDYEDSYRTVVRTEFKSARGPKTADPVFRRCVLVDNTDGTKWIDSVVAEIATKLY